MYKPIPTPIPTISLCALLAIGLPAYAGEAPIPTVTVSAAKGPIVNKLDKTVHDVSSMARAANGTAQDVLQSIPGVSVTADGRIAVKGNANVTVLVDGKPSAMLSGEERAVALQTMGGAGIASVEVITNPSAAYQAGGGAIVNLVTTRKRKRGTRAQLRGSAATHGLWNGSLSGDTTTGKLNASASLAWRHDGTAKSRDSRVDWRNPASGASGHTRQRSQVFVRRAVRSAALGLDYAMGDTASLAVAARANQRASRPLLDTFNEVRSGAGQSLFHRVSVGPNEQSDHSASVAYSRQGGARALKAMLQHSATVGLVDKSYRDLHMAPARPVIDSRGATRAARRLDQATLDYSGALPGGQWGAGIDLQDEVNQLDNYQAFIDAGSGAEIADPATTNRYAVTTTLGAAYLTRQIRQAGWEVLLGGRFERMALRLQPADGAPHRRGWRAFNPSLHARYTLGESAALTLGYRRSLQRPDPRDLNPFTTYIDAQQRRRGNPDLDPQRLASWELGAELERGKLSAGVQAFHRISRALVTDAFSVSSGVGGDNVLFASKENGGRGRASGVTGSLEWTPSSAWRAGFDAGVYAIALHTPGQHATRRQDGVAGYLNARASYSAAGGQLALDAHAQSATITALGREGSTSSVNLSWKRQLSKSVSVTVNANDVFDGSRRSHDSDSGTVRQWGFEHFVARRLYIGLVKDLGQGQ